MLERLLILVGCAVLVYLGWQLLRWQQARRLQALAVERPFAELLPHGQPAIVAFSLPTCGECRARQAPALSRLHAQFGTAIQVTTLRADTHAELANKLGIMTVPSTVVLDPQGAVRYLNQGFADEQRLAEQLATVNK
jgi:thiol-disulfide isomerase/thioredoxin